MCWSFAASVGMVAVGGAATALTVHRQLPPVVPTMIGYFTVMEALQAAGYFVIGDCGTTANQLITLLSYLHIVFQPFFINAFAMYLIPEPVSRRIRTTVYALCGASSAFMLLQLAPLDWAGGCRIGQPLCGTDLCLRAGAWHIAWDIPYNGLTIGTDNLVGMNLGFPTYVLTVVFLPLLYGSWRFALFHFFAGPLLASFTTTDVNEIPAVWCLFSIAIILIALIPKLMGQLHSPRWFLWPMAWRVPAV